MPNRDSAAVSQGLQEAGVETLKIRAILPNPGCKKTKIENVSGQSIQTISGAEFKAYRKGDEMTRHPFGSVCDQFIHEHKIYSSAITCREMCFAPAFFECLLAMLLNNMQLGVAAPFLFACI